MRILGGKPASTPISKVRRIRSEFENSQNFPFPAYVATTVSNLLRARFRIRTNPLNGVFVFLETREYSISLGIEESLTESKRESPNQIEMTSVVMCDVKRKSKEKLQSFFFFLSFDVTKCNNSDFRTLSRWRGIHPSVSSGTEN